jgi:hypothetical protein
MVRRDRACVRGAEQANGALNQSSGCVLSNGESAMRQQAWRETRGTIFRGPAWGLLATLSALVIMWSSHYVVAAPQEADEAEVIVDEVAPEPAAAPAPAGQAARWSRCW